MEKLHSYEALDVTIENSLTAKGCRFGHWTPSVSQYCSGVFAFFVSIENRNEFVAFSCRAEIMKSVNSVYKDIRLVSSTGVVSSMGVLQSLSSSSRQTITEKARVEEIRQTVRYTIHDSEAGSRDLRQILQLQLSDDCSFIDSSELVQEDIKIRQNF